MLVYFLERSAKLEIIIRKLVTKCEPIKKYVKRLIRNDKKRKKNTVHNEELAEKLKKKLMELKIGKGDIIIIHSSMDGLEELGLTADEILDIILNAFYEATIVFAAFPIESNKKKELYRYTPQKTLSWTGVLSNTFLKRRGVLRSIFPYNSLAAIGADASPMMENNMQSKRPHDIYSAWEYCRQHHAKLLFLGTTSRESNTMALHMVPDIMGKNWPIKDWYVNRKYVITDNDRIINKEIEIQDGFWYQFVNEYKTDYLLKKKGYVKNISIDSIPIEIVDDSNEMINFLVEMCRSGKLMYTIPKKYYKQNIL